MTATASEDIDWQNRQVIDRLVTKLVDEILPWTQVTGYAPANLRDDLRRAVDYAGEKLDAFQMVRYLEDSRRWPGDQHLVRSLCHAKHWRDIEVAQLKDELAPKPEGDYQVGHIVKVDGGSSRYQITAIERVKLSGVARTLYTIVLIGRDGILNPARNYSIDEEEMKRAFVRDK